MKLENVSTFSISALEYGNLKMVNCRTIKDHFGKLRLVGVGGGGSDEKASESVVYLRSLDLCYFELLLLTGNDFLATCQKIVFKKIN